MTQWHNRRIGKVRYRGEFIDSVERAEGGWKVFIRRRDNRELVMGGTKVIRLQRDAIRRQLKSLGLVFLG